MSWINIAIGVAVLLAIGWLVRRSRRAGPDAEILFDMTLPSKWAAELSQQVLENEGTTSEIGQVKGQWVCRVRLGERFQAARCERLRAHFDQIAVARGGDCPNVRVVCGDESIVYEAHGR
jgi:hypothetical protein